jgi:hypothetical protein
VAKKICAPVVTKQFLKATLAESKPLEKFGLLVDEFGYRDDQSKVNIPTDVVLFRLFLGFLTEGQPGVSFRGGGSGRGGSGTATSFGCSFVVGEGNLLLIK